MARGSGNLKRAELMSSLERRLPDVLRGLQIEVWGSAFDFKDLLEAYDLMARGHEPGDAMVWVRMKKAGLRTIATADASDWRSLGADVIPLA